MKPRLSSAASYCCWSIAMCYGWCMTTALVADCPMSRNQSDPLVVDSPIITPHSYQRINDGMGEDEVVKLLRCSSGCYFDGNVLFITVGAVEPPLMFTGDRNAAKALRLQWSIPPRTPGDPVFVTKGWIGTELGIWITFANGRVVSKGCHPVFSLGLAGKGAGKGAIAPVSRKRCQPEKVPGTDPIERSVK